MFATFVDNKSVIITSPDRNKLHTLNLNLLHHKKAHNKWMNKGFKYIPNNHGSDLVELIEDNNITIEDFSSILMEICYLDMDDPNDSRQIEQMYELSKLHIFMMHDYQYIPEIPLLTIHGVMIEKETDDELFDLASYLNAIVDLNIDEDKYL
jgi:hypothetical protein